MSATAYGDFSLQQSNALGGDPIAAGTSRLYINNQGNVGIGTVSPTSTLYVQGSGSVNPFQVSSSTGTGLMIITSQGNVGIGTTGPTSKLDVWGNLNVATSSTPTLFVNTATGNVGLGTSSPTSLLQLLGTSANQFRLGYDAADYSTLGVTSDGGLTLTTNGATPNFSLALNSGGNFGINNGALFFGGTNHNLAINNSASAAQFEVAVPSGAQTDAVPIMTGGTTPSGVADASGYYGANPLYAPWHAFDDNSGTYWDNGAALPGWLSYQFSSPKIIVKYTLISSNYPTYGANTWTFEGWNGSSWVVLDTETNVTTWTSKNTYTFSNTTAYIKYRINVSATNGGGRVVIQEMEMMEGTSYTSAFAVSTTGNVGVGTATPFAKLVITSATTTENLLQVATTTNNSIFIITANGNIGIGTSTPELGPIVAASGANLSAAGVWNSVSDVNSKENFTDLSPQDILNKINALKITQWSYKLEGPSITHIGPMAQDFYAQFKAGNSSTTLSTIDPAGVALLGIQALDQRITALQGGLINQATTSLLTVYSPSNFSGDSVGQAKILAGSTSVRVTFSQPYKYQPIVTVTLMGEPQKIFYSVKDVDAAGFTIAIAVLEQPINGHATEDTLFSWHSFASPEAKLTVSDGSISDVVLVVPQTLSPLSSPASPDNIVGVQGEEGTGGSASSSPEVAGTSTSTIDLTL